ncbi:Uncharacterised protein [Mycobacteroides abscessus subsp. abscessus]|nr:Uncharacterised protein [Mycobacteroides abscessus subsp. abscessus]
MMTRPSTGGVDSFQTHSAGQFGSSTFSVREPRTAGIQFVTRSEPSYARSSSTCGNRVLMASMSLVSRNSSGLMARSR